LLLQEKEKGGGFVRSPKKRNPVKLKERRRLIEKRTGPPRPFLGEGGVEAITGGGERGTGH